MKKYFMIFCVAATLFSACKKDSSSTKDTTEEEFAETLQNVSSLYLSQGNVNGDTVLMYVQGGPVAELGTEDLDAFPVGDHYHKVYVHQAQTLNPSLIGPDTSFETAVTEDRRSIAILNKVIDHFKDQGKAVYVIGHSFGAFLTPFYIYKYGNKADKMFIMAGRLDMPDVVWQGFRDGQNYNFPDGITPTPTDDTEGGTFEQIGANRLAAGVGQNRYTQMLADKDLSKVIYMYGTKDIPVGSLTDEEDSFLRGKGAQVIRIEDGHHGVMFEAPYNQQVVSIIRE